MGSNADFLGDPAAWTENKSFLLPSPTETNVHLRCTHRRRPQVSSIPGGTITKLGREYPADWLSVFAVDEEAQLVMDKQEKLYRHLGGLPNLETEYWMRTLLGRHSDLKILAVGAGLCTWVGEVAQRFPEATIFAMDVFNFRRPIPENVIRYIGDANIDLPSEKFDYIHLRGLNGCIDNWSDFMKRARPRLTPRGYAHYLDISLEFVKDHEVSAIPGPWKMASQFIKKVSGNTRRTFHVDLKECKSWMKAAGLEIFYTHRFPTPIAGTEVWMEDLRFVVIEKIVGIVTYHHSMTGVKAKQHNAFIDKLRYELNQDCHNVVVEIVVVIGRSPS
ncbi:hypothetical protein BR93DRAFT_964424 [Coniochaeta sp. PMI_546]|nr:hypothetical protein BR93DRAFT_964424 [Coniochaeta sp. PMI_546]